MALGLAPLALTAAIVAAVAFVVPELAGFQTPAAQPQPPAIEGKVRRIVDDRIEPDSRGEVRVRTLEVDLGSRGIVTIEQRQVPGEPALIAAAPGDRVLTQSTAGPNGPRYFIADYVRTLPLLALTALFTVFVLLFGRWHGLRSLAGIAASFVIILQFVLPGILAGHNPMLIALTGGMAITVGNLYLAHGMTRKTTVAFVGMIAALAITVGLGTVSIEVAKLTGLAEENASTVNILLGGQIDGRGLLLAGMIIGALGVLDDVTVAQASAVWEVHRANPLLGARRLYESGMNIGRDHIASTVNTLVLAYAGAALPLLIILTTQTESWATLANREFLAVEIIRTLVGSIGIVAAVPLTTALAAIAAGHRLAESAAEHEAPPVPAAKVSHAPARPSVEPRPSREEFLESLRRLNPPRHYRR